MGWYPLTFEPVFKERIWGGRRLEQLYGKRLPPGVPIGESWEVTDRPEGVSVITNGPLAGRTLRELMENHREELLGAAWDAGGKFPLLIKILDAQDILSLQVHPPESVARRLGGEPKTEMWYVADAEPGAHLLVGLKRGVTREEFERKVRAGTAAECVHRVPVQKGDAMFLPAGRIHAIGAGLVLFEIQQNSDTTYRVFDWNRVGPDGKPRPLHIAEAMESIDFSDYEPGLVRTEFEKVGPVRRRPLVPENPLFEVWEYRVDEKSGLELGDTDRPWIVAVVEGTAQVAAGEGTTTLQPGQFALMPAVVGRFRMEGEKGTVCLVTTPKPKSA